MSTPQKVNAAQLAARKIKAPTRRKAITTHDGGGGQVPLFAPMPSASFGGAAGGNLFGGSMSANNSFNFAAPVQTTFGGSVNFPNSTQPSSAGTSSPTTQQPGGLFGSQSFGGNPSNPSNPFGSTVPSSGFSFGDTAAPASTSFTFGQSTPAQPAQPSGGVFSFGQSSQQAAPASNPFQMQQPSSQTQPGTPGLSFGSTVTDKPAGGFSFDSSKQGAAPANPFGGFGNPAAADKPAAPAFSFGQTMSQQPSQAGSQVGSIPGSPQASRPGSPAAFNVGTPAPEKPAASLFGGFGAVSQAQTPGATAAAPASTSNFFGQATPSAAPTSNFFSQPAAQNATPASNMFGNAAQTPAPVSTPFGATTRNPFDSVKAPEAAASPAPRNPFDSVKAPDGAPSPAPRNPFDSVKAPDGAPSPAPRNPFDSVKAPDAAPSPAPSASFFGSQTSRSVSPEKDMSGNESTGTSTPNIFGAKAQQPAAADNLSASASSTSIFGDKPTLTPGKSKFGSSEKPEKSAPKGLFSSLKKPGASPDKSVFSNLSSASPAKNLFGGEKKADSGESLFVAQTPKSTSSFDMFGKPKTSEGTPQKPADSSVFSGKTSTTPATSIFGTAQKPSETINIFAGKSFESNVDDNAQAANNGDSALSEISNGANSPSRNGPPISAKLTEVNAATKLSPPQPQFPPKSPLRTITNASSISSESTALVRVTDKSEAERASFEKTILDRAVEYDESELFSRGTTRMIARVIAKYFPTSISPRQQLEAFAAIQIRNLKKSVRSTIESEQHPAKRATAIHVLEDMEKDIKRWGQTQARRVEKRKADRLEDYETSNEGPNKRQKPLDAAKPIAPPIFGSPVKSISDKALSNGSTTPKAPAPAKNFFSPALTPAEPSPSPKGKRKAEAQMTKDDEETGFGKQIKLNGSGSSATSNLFRGLVGKTPQKSAKD